MIAAHRVTDRVDLQPHSLLAILLNLGPLDTLLLLRHDPLLLHPDGETLVKPTLLTEPPRDGVDLAAPLKRALEVL